MREVSRVGDHLDPGVGRQRGDGLRVPRRDHPVVAAPHDPHRHRLGEVGAVGHRDDLALPVDHRAGDVTRGPPGGRVLEGVEDPGDLVEVAGLPAADGGEGAQPRDAQVPQAGQGEDAHQLVEAGRGDRADAGMHLGPEAAGRHDHQALGALGELVGELHRHATAEAVPDDGHLVDAEHGEQVAHAVGVAAHAVVGAGLVGPAVAEQVGRDHGEPPAQPLDHRLPGGVVAGQAVQEQQRRASAHLHEGAPVTVDGHELHVVPSGHERLPMCTPACCKW